MAFTSRSPSDNSWREIVDDHRDRRQLVSNGSETDTDKMTEQQRLVPQDEVRTGTSNRPCNTSLAHVIRCRNGYDRRSRSCKPLTRVFSATAGVDLEESAQSAKVVGGT
jgi:hypothetical protein